MKQQLSIFLTFLLLLNCSIAMNIKNNLLSSSSVMSFNKENNAEKSKNFIDTKMLETCDEGILADVDFTNVFYMRSNYATREPYTLTGVITPAENEVLIPQYNYQINVGENGKSMSRLNIRLVIPGLRLNHLKDYPTYKCRMMLDTIELASYWYRHHDIKGLAWDDLTLIGTLFNVPPGLYVVSLRCYAYYMDLQFGSSEINPAYIEFKGEYAAGSIPSNQPNNFLLPVTPKQLPKRKSKFIFVVDNYFSYISVNGNNIERSYYDKDVNSCCDSKAYPILLSDGDILSFRGVDTGAKRGIIVSVNYYNSLGYPEIYNSSYTNYSIDNYNGTITENISINSDNKPSKWEADKSYLPIDYSAQWIWGSTTSNPTATATAPLPITNRSSVMFVQACPTLVEVKVNSETAKINSETASTCEKVQQLKSTENIPILKSGDKISIKINKTYDKSRKTKIIDIPIYSTGFVSALISYKNKDGQVVEIRTDENTWTCAGKPAQVQPIQNNFRSDFYLTTAFEARAIFETFEKELTCETTLP